MMMLHHWARHVTSSVQGVLHSQLLLMFAPDPSNPGPLPGGSPTPGPVPSPAPGQCGAGGLVSIDVTDGLDAPGLSGAQHVINMIAAFTVLGCVLGAVVGILLATSGRVADSRAPTVGRLMIFSGTRGEARPRLLCVQSSYRLHQQAAGSMNQPRLLAEIHRAAGWLTANDLLKPEHSVASLPTPRLVVDGRMVISFSSNNYLGLSHHVEVKAAALDALGMHSYSTSESRRLGGNLQLLQDLETALASYKQMPAAMVTATGLLANVAAVHGVIDSVQLANRWHSAPGRTTEAVVVYDELAHRSIRIGARLADATRRKFRHNDANHLVDILSEYRDHSVLVVTEGVFSMDGDLGDLPNVLAACEQTGATLLVDDAHGTGLYGPSGSGTVEHFGLTGRVPLQVATLSKAFGGLGGVVLGDRTTVTMLRMFASGYRFTSSLPAEMAAGVLATLRIMREQPELRDRVWVNARRLRAGLVSLGLSAAGEGPIVPLIVGSASTAQRLESLLLERGYWCAAALPPLVAPNECRLRMTVTAMHGSEDIDGLLDAIQHLIRADAIPAPTFAATSSATVHRWVATPAVRSPDAPTGTGWSL